MFQEPQRRNDHSLGMTLGLRRFANRRYRLAGDVFVVGKFSASLEGFLARLENQDEGAARASSKDLDFIACSG